VGATQYPRRASPVEDRQPSRFTKDEARRIAANIAKFFYAASTQIKCERLNNKIGLITAMTMAKKAIHSGGSRGSGTPITS
jgi:hypothetical protein